MPDLAHAGTARGHGIVSKRVLITVGVAFAVAAAMGDVMTAPWFDTHPVWLVSLNARNRILLLVSQNIGVVAFMATACLRLFVPDIVFYELGRRHGAEAVAWIEDRLETSGRLLRWSERAFERFGAPTIVVAPNVLLVTMAGVARMRPRTFYTLNVLGTVGRIAMIWYVAQTFSEGLEMVLDLVQTYRGWLTLASLLIVGGTIGRDVRAARARRRAVQDTAPSDGSPDAPVQPGVAQAATRREQ